MRYMLNISDEEKQALLNQHSKPYDGYQTLRFPEPDNRIYTYDPAGDKEGITVNNRGEVKKYTNMGINESKSNVDEFFYYDMEDEETKQAKATERQQDLNYILSILGNNSEKSDEFLDEGVMCESCGGNMYEDVCESCGNMSEGSVAEPHYGSFDYVENKMCECGGMYNEGTCNECGGMYESVNEISEPYSELDFSNYDFDSKGPEQFGDEDMETGEELIPSFDSDGNFIGMVKPSGDMELDGKEMYSNEKPAYEFDSPGPYGSTNTFEEVENPEGVKQSIKESLNWFKRFSKFN